jgi:DNA-binding CsgD family transcriptional regulator
VARVRQLGLERTYGVALQAIAVNTLFRLGRWSEADVFLRQAFAAKPTGTAAINLCLARAKLSVGRGEFAAAESDLRAVEALAAGGLGLQYEAPLLTLRAGLDLWLGHPQRAREAVNRGIMASINGSDDVWLLAPLIWHGLRAEADLAAAAGLARDRAGHDAATTMAAGLWAQVQSLGDDSLDAAPSIRLAIEAYLRMCEGEARRARGDSDPDVWAEAAKRWQELQQPYPAAYARWREAEALLGQRSRSARAAESLRAAHQVAVSLGATPFRREVESLASRARISLVEGGTEERTPTTAAEPLPPAPPDQTPRVPDRASARAAAKGRYRLSDRELDVWLQLPVGLSNNQIGERLFISGKTVSVHVTNILRKLEVKTRVQAIALAYQLGMVDPPPQ